MTTMVAVLKILNDFCSRKVIWIKLKLGGPHWGDMEIPNQYPSWPPRRPSRNSLKRHLLPNCNADWAKTWREASGRHRDSELFRYLRWPPRCPSWKSSNLICSRMVSRIESKLGGRHLGDIEIHHCLTIFLRYPRQPPQQLSRRSSIFRSFALGQLMPRLGDYDPPVIHLSISNFSHFRHLRQNCIHNGCHRSHLESLQFSSAPKTVSRMEPKLGGRH